MRIATRWIACLALFLMFGCGGESTVADIEKPCDAISCLNGATCVDNGNGTAFCECASGWSGPDCGLPVPTDPCDPNPCLNGGACSDAGDGTSACACVNGYTGQVCETAPANPCEPNPCLNGGTCNNNGDGTSSCACAAGYTGDTCEIAPADPCDPNPCLNGGSCAADGNGGFECTCAAGYTGDTCETEALDPCEPNPCNNGGSCAADGSGGFECTCAPGYTGDTCETEDADPCTPNPCKNGGTCNADANGNASCTCPEGFEGPYCDTETVNNVCDPNPCMNAGTCIPKVTPGAESCLGEQMVAGCAESKACEDAVCNLDSFCCDTQWDSTCGDFAQNTPECKGSTEPSCQCPPDFTGALCETPAGEGVCAQNPCQNGGICTEVESAGAAACLVAQDVPGCAASQACEEVVCNLDPFCCQTTWDPSCANCANGQPGFGGIDCSAAGPICAAPGGDMVAECSCLEGYFGPFCENEVVDGCEPNPCLNGGTCTTLDQVGGYACDCPDDWFGTNCEQEAVNGCEPNPCLNGGTCDTLDEFGGYACKCPDGFTGANCDIEIDTEGYVFIGSYQVNDGEAWGTDPPTYSCIEGCAAVFGGTSGEYACSTVETGVDHQGWYSTWGVSGCSIFPEGYKKSQTYNCGQADCATSAYVTDNCTANGSQGVNFCYKFNPIGTCDPDPCLNGGVCTENDDGTYNCACPDLFGGVNCETELDNPCDPDPCLNGGACNIVSELIYTCECADGYVGTNCEIPPPCEPNPCLNGGICAPGEQGGFSCECINGWKGQLCDIAPPDPCIPNPCQNLGTCTSFDDGSYTCECPENTSGDNCEFFDTGNAFEQAFSYTGDVQIFTVPENVTKLTIQALGAQGGGSNSCVGDSQDQEDGGKGGYARGILNVTPGQTLYIYVGGAGKLGTDEAEEGGWNGGGDGGKWGGGGGGASDVRTTQGDLNARIIVAGGGGGGNTGCPEHGFGGDGGGLTGANGNNGDQSWDAAGGGTQNAGGAAGSNGAAGEFGQGANPVGSTYHFAGGGGGWYGGGSAYAAGAGGGSGYVGGVEEGFLQTGGGMGHGSVVVSWDLDGPVVPECKERALLLDGTNCLSIPGVFNAEASTFTIEFWVRVDSYETGWATSALIDQIEAPGFDKPGMRLELANEGPWAQKIRYEETTLNGGTSGGYALTDFQTADWQHIALVRTPDPVSGASTCIYINGVEDTCVSALLFQPSVANAGTLKIGCADDANGDLNRYFVGAMDELRISNIARYDSNFDPAKVFETDDNTVLLYHFDLDENQAVVDASGNGLDATWNGTAIFTDAAPAIATCEQ